MPYSINIVPAAEKDFKKIPSRIQTRIREKIIGLKKEPRPRGTKRLQASSCYRIRSGDYRIIYEINDREYLVTILAVGHRREVYRG